MWSLSGSLMVQAQGINTIALSGYWEGAFIVANTQQPIKIQFYQEEGNWKCLQIMEEWHPQFGEFLQAVTFDSTNRLKFSSGYGVANVVLDPQNLELIGSIENSDPPMSIHLKKIPSPPPPDYEVSEVIITNKEIELYGHLHTPKFQKAKNSNNPCRRQRLLCREYKVRSLCKNSAFVWRSCSGVPKERQW